MDVWIIELTYLFKHNVAFHIETSYFICYAKQMTGFYLKYNTGLKLAKWMVS